ncbi:MAG: antitoxin [Bryobacteraceae bacterium]
MRITLDIDDRILREVKAIHQKEGKSMGAVVSELLADALARRDAHQSRPAFRWVSRPMKARVNLEDKDAVYAILDAGRR